MSHVRNHRAVEVGAANFLAAHGLEEGPAVRKRRERPAEGARPPAGGRRAPSRPHSFPLVPCRLHVLLERAELNPNLLDRAESEPSQSRCHGDPHPGRTRAGGSVASARRCGLLRASAVPRPPPRAASLPRSVVLVPRPPPWAPQPRRGGRPGGRQMISAQGMGRPKYAVSKHHLSLIAPFTTVKTINRARAVCTWLR